MRVTSFDELNLRADINDIRQNSRKATLLIPTITSGSGFDSDTQSGLDVFSGDGTGRTVTWAVYEFYGIIRPVTQALVTYGQVPSGVEVGDVILEAALIDSEIVQGAYTNEWHYLVIDGTTWRINSYTYSGLGRNDNLVIGCKHFTPSVFRNALY